MKRRKGITLVELCIAIALTSFIAMLAAALLNMSTKASVLTKQANEAITYEVEFTENVIDAIQTSTTVFTIPKRAFTKENLTKEWNYIGLMEISEFEGGQLPEAVVDSLGVKGAQPISTGRALVMVEYAGDTRPSEPTDGVIMQNVDGYFIVHIKGYDYVDAKGETHTYTLEALPTDEYGIDTASRKGVSLKVIDTVTDSEGNFVSETIHVDTVVTARDAQQAVYKGDSMNPAIAVAYRNQNMTTVKKTVRTENTSIEEVKETVASTVIEEQKKTVSQTTTVTKTETVNNPFTVVVLMDVTSEMNNKAQNSDSQAKLANMKTSVNRLLDKLSAYDAANVILIPYSSVSKASGNFADGSQPQKYRFNISTELSAAKSLVNNLVGAGKSANPGDGLRSAYNTLVNHKNAGNEIGKVYVVLYSGKRMEAFSTTNATGNAKFTSSTSLYPEYVRMTTLNYYPQYFGALISRYDSEFWVGYKTGSTIGSNPEQCLNGASQLDQHYSTYDDGSNHTAVTRVRYRTQVGLAQDYVVEQYNRIKADPDFNVQGAYCIYMWNMPAETSVNNYDFFCYNERCGFNMINAYNSGLSATGITDMLNPDSYHSTSQKTTTENVTTTKEVTEYVPVTTYSEVTKYVPVTTYTDTVVELITDSIWTTDGPRGI